MQLHRNKCSNANSLTKTISEICSLGTIIASFDSLCPQSTESSNPPCLVGVGQLYEDDPRGLLDGVEHRGGVHGERDVAAH